jgi:hypothetical protein
MRLLEALLKAFSEPAEQLEKLQGQQLLTILQFCFPPRCEVSILRVIFHKAGNIYYCIGMQGYKAVYLEVEPLWF